ncbi:hypothetical protein HDV00_010018 [Rhizophlyctis rosea]|nr:hypothetical protein HDV00_010018 [Rhizophlyctis rosea]
MFSNNADSALCYRVGMSCDVATLKVLLDHGFVAECAVVAMLYEDNLPLISHLLSQGLDPNRRSRKYDQSASYSRGSPYDNDFFCLFELAVGVGNLEVLRMILECGWKPEGGMSLVRVRRRVGEGPRVDGRRGRREKDLDWYATLVPLLVQYSYTFDLRDVQHLVRNCSEDVVFNVLSNVQDTAMIPNIGIMLGIMQNSNISSKISVLQWMVETFTQEQLFSNKWDAHESMKLALEKGTDDGEDECLQIVQLLVDSGAKVVRSSCELLLGAAEKGRYDVMEVLVRGGAVPGRRVFGALERRGDVVGLEMLERHGWKQEVEVELRRSMRLVGPRRSPRRGRGDGSGGE